MWFAREIAKTQGCRNPESKKKITTAIVTKTKLLSVLMKYTFKTKIQSHR